MANYSAGNLSVEFLGIDKTLSATLDDIIARLEKLEKVTSNISKGGKVNGKDSFMSKFTLGFAYGKIRAITSALTKMARFTSQILQHGVDYTETLNLWQVAMGDNLSMAQDFVTQMNKAYGISEKTLMNAQAIFKNMIGSLGQISDTMAYNLSEAITQMAIDYASLYNVSIDSAITKFQAALAGQVRPIRSVSGYDITENTLYQLYQSIGGTKTMRQLSRTEKQLLSIYAIYQQMGASGALGDMEKTIDQVANQSRMMTENWKQMATWAGVSLQYILQQSGAFRTINALLITGAEIFKSIAFSLGYETPDFANNWADNVEDTEKAVDDLQGKLLDFDKFRSLSGTEENILGIDTKLMEAISGYTSDIGNAVNESRKLAEQWLKTLGFVDENGDGVYEITQRAKDLGEALKETLKIVKVIGTTIIAYKMINFIGNITTRLGKLKDAFNPKTLGLTALVSALMYAYVTNEDFRNSVNNLVNTFAKPFGDLVNSITPVLTTIIDLVAEFVVLLDKTELLEIAIVALISYGIYNRITKIASGFVNLVDKVGTFATNLLKQSGLIETKLPLATKSITSMQLATSALTGALGFLVGDMLLSNLGEDARRVVAPIMLAVGAITSLVMAMLALQGVMSWGTALPIITAGIGVAIAGVKGMLKVDNYANGGLPDKGTLFRAGEAGAEIVYNTPSGQSGVVNVQQIEQAMYGALVRYGKSNGGNGQPIEVYLDGEKVYQNTTAHAKRRGNIWGRA